MSEMLSRPTADGVLLLCLDALIPASDCDGAALGPDLPWRANAARLLDHARAQGWTTGHAISRRRLPGETPWRPAEGLAPMPKEPVYHREQPSAFASPELCATLAGPARPEVVLCGLSLHGSLLATAVDAQRRGVCLTLALDAAGLSPAEQPGLDGLLRLQRMGHLSSIVRTAATETLLRPWRPLKLVVGGRDQTRV
ncbi:MAG: isochorismatase family protein [Proteobacteria bacterium]|nr:isochorismatase family protein [Pseudomonadota bacterium]